MVSRRINFLAVLVTATLSVGCGATAEAQSKTTNAHGVSTLEGLSPGFWATHSQFGPAPHTGWPATGFDAFDGYEVIFGVSHPGAPTLLEALTMRDKFGSFLRHSAAALLNASHPNIDHRYTVEEVVFWVQLAAATGDFESIKDAFEIENERGAQLDA